MTRRVRPPTPAATVPAPSPVGASTATGGGGAPPAPASVSEPGIYEMSATAYQADPCPEPSLTSSICKLLCLDSAAHAWQEHPRLNPAAERDHEERFDIGTAAHALLLEGEAGVTVVDRPDWRTAEARAARDTAYAQGKTPLLTKHWTAVQAMVASARGQLARHRDGGAQMFTNGVPERVLVWREDDVWCRARIDWLRDGAIDDYKTTPQGTANPEAWTRSMFFAGVDIQVAWYLRGVKAVTGTDAVFRFAVQEAYAPYALSVVGLGPDALVLAEKKILYALEQWRACRASGDWIGYPRKTCWAVLPPIHEAWWLEKELR